MAKDTLFRMASSTKPVTGVAVLMLVEEGKIRLIRSCRQVHSRVQRPESRDEKNRKVELVPADRPITIHDLLTHTSGLLSSGIGTRQAPRGHLSHGRRYAREICRPCGQDPLDFQPGSK